MTVAELRAECIAAWQRVVDMCEAFDGRMDKRADEVKRRIRNLRAAS
jgi:hypothetical protein